MPSPFSSWRPAATLLDWAFAHGDSVEPVGRLVDRGEVPEPPVAAGPPEDASEASSAAPAVTSSARGQRGVPRCCWSDRGTAVRALSGPLRFAPAADPVGNAW